MSVCADWQDFDSYQTRRVGYRSVRIPCKHKAAQHLRRDTNWHDDSTITQIGSTDSSLAPSWCHADSTLQAEPVDRESDLEQLAAAREPSA